MEVRGAGDVPVRATAMGGGVRPMRRFDQGRTCEEPGCETRLSVYNARERCWQHEEHRAYSPCRGRPRADRRLPTPVDLLRR